MGAVYLARVTGIGGFQREVALKLMHAHLKLDPELSRHLVQEANLAVKIRHPNVVSVIDVGDDPFGIYLVMDYVEGDTLSAVQRLAARESTGLPLRFGMKIMLDALAGLHAAHELLDENGNSLDLVHRDFSPQNVLVGIDGIARLTDFGIAKATSGEGSTSTGIIKGKIAYMPPEQARGETVDRRADIWSAGVVAWQVVTGRKLYPGKINDAAVLLKVTTQRPPHVREVKPDAPRELADVIANALQMKPEDRYPTALAFRNALSAACRSLGETADSEEVGAFVRGLVEPIVNERRIRAKEISELRAKMGRLAETKPTTDSSSHDVARDPQTKDANAFEAISTPAKTIVTLSSSDIVLEATRTDATSVADSYGTKRLDKTRWIAIGAAAICAVSGFFLWLSLSKKIEIDPPAASQISSSAPTSQAASASPTAAPSPTAGTTATVSASASSSPKIPDAFATHPRVRTTPPPTPTKNKSLLPASPYDGHR